MRRMRPRNRENKKQALLFALLVMTALAAAGAALFIGSVHLDAHEVREAMRCLLTRQMPESKNIYNLVVYVRLPRIILNLLGGAILSVAGILMQTLTHNPLAEPYVLGVSSGASTGAAGAIVFHWFAFLQGGRIFFSAFVFSFLAIMLVLLLQGRSTSSVRLVLTGMGVSAFFQAATTLIVYMARDEAQARSAQFWITGSFSGADWTDVRIAAAAAIVLLLFCLAAEKELDLLLLGKRAAEQTGLNIRAVQMAVIGVTSLAVSVIVAQTGIVGFVGLIIPHIIRKAAGAKHRWLILCSIPAGAAFLTAADTTARTVFAPQELPIGVMTAFVGAPVFLFIIHRVYHEDNS